MSKRYGAIPVLALASLGIVGALTPSRATGQASGPEGKQSFRQIDLDRQVVSEQALEAILQVLANASEAERQLLIPKKNPCWNIVMGHSRGTREEYQRCFTERIRRGCDRMTYVECGDTRQCRALPPGDEQNVCILVCLFRSNMFCGGR